MDSKSLWYMQRKAGTVEGPYTDQQILKMAMEGSVSRTAKVRHIERTKNEWILATAVPGLGSIVLNNSSPVAESSPPKGATSHASPASSTQRGKPSESNELGHGVPRWIAANPTASRNESLSQDYWDSMSSAVAEDLTVESYEKTEEVQGTWDHSRRSRKILKRQLYDLFVAGALMVLVLAILISGGLFLAGSLMLGYSDQELQAMAKRVAVPGFGRNDGDGSEEPDVQPVTTGLDFPSLSGTYNVGDEGRANQELLSIEEKRILAGKKEDLHELDARLLEEFRNHGFMSAEMTIEPRAGGTGEQSLVCSITNIVRTIPAVDDCGTALGRDCFEKLLKLARNREIVVVLCQEELQDIAIANDAIRRKLLTKMPREILDPQETEKLLDLLNRPQAKQQTTSKQATSNPGQALHQPLGISQQ